MNVFRAYLVGLLTGAVLIILVAQKKPPTRNTEPLPKIVVDVEAFLRTL